MLSGSTAARIQLQNKLTDEEKSRFGTYIGYRAVQWNSGRFQLYE